MLGILWSCVCRPSPLFCLAMQYTVDPEQSDLLWDSMTVRFWQMGVSFLLYGIYLNLFLLTIHTLSRQRTLGRKPLIIASCIMAVLGTTQIALNIVETVLTARFAHQVLRAQVSTQTRALTTLSVLSEAQGVVSAINYFVTDTLFLYRCYVIWGSQRKILILPGFLMLCTFVVAILGSHSIIMDIRIPYSISAATNLVLTFSTAGRIWWMRRAASHVGLGKALRGRYNTAMAIILESGAIYCTAAIFFIVVASQNEEIYVIGGGIEQQLINIIPTFTLVYVGLNNRVEDAPVGGSCKTSSNFHVSPTRTVRVVQPSRPSSVGLDFEKEETKQTDVDCV
ncbi:hypothetical protein MVEN_02348100 [Mycena venus]|uniref:Uncharacterized protein n=1 Tax=Mycena venus TaxID=2733690 RepID=A0A8H7CFA2_9AGAR|nr:hypothetical protein MVEN_02348100 [Mycena venus]